MKTPGERLAWARERAGFSSSRAAAIENGWPPSTYYAHEHDTRSIDAENAKRYGRRYRVHWMWILHGDAAPAPIKSTFVRGYVSVGARVHFGAETSETQEADLPPGLTPAATALIVRGDVMSPVYDDGDLLYYDEPSEGPAIADLVGLRCVAQIVGGHCLVKKLGRGTAAGLFTLWSHNAEPIYDAKLEWASAIEWHRQTRGAGK
jgi:hypothetical protein